MKKLLGIALALLPSFCFADRLGSLRSAADVLLTTQAVTLTSVIHSTGSPQVGAQFSVDSGTINGPFYVNGPGPTLIQLTIGGSTFTVVSGSNTNNWTVGHSLVVTSTNGTAGDSGSAGGGSGTPGTPLNSLQYNNASSLAGITGTVVTASSVSVNINTVIGSTLTVLPNGGAASANTGRNMIDVWVNAAGTNNIANFGSSSQGDQLVIPNNTPIQMTHAGALIGGIGIGQSGSGRTIFSNSQPLNLIDLQTGSTMTFQTGNVSGPGDMRFLLSGTTMFYLSNQTGNTLGASGSTTTVLGQLVTNLQGLVVSSGISISAATSIITATSTITSTMSVVLASCTAMGTSNNFITLTLPDATASSGMETMIYDVGTDSCSIRISGAGTDVIEGTGTITLNAKSQRASLQSLGALGWAAGLGNIQYTPHLLMSISQDNGTYTNTTSSAVEVCPVFSPVSLAVTGFRLNRVTASGTNFFSVGIFDQNGKYLIGLSTQTALANTINYLLPSVYTLPPGWYKVGIALVNTSLSFTGSNSLASQTAYCAIGATPTHLDLSQVTLTTGGSRANPAPWIGILVNGGQNSF